MPYTVHMEIYWSEKIQPDSEHMTSPETQDVNWTYIRRSEDVQDAFWKFYVRSIYVLCLLGYIKST